MSKTLIVVCEHRVEVPETFTLGHQTCKQLKADVESTPQPELSNYLYEKETITGDEFMAILNGSETKEANDHEKTV